MLENPPTNKSSLGYQIYRWLWIRDLSVEHLSQETKTSVDLLNEIIYNDKSLSTNTTVNLYNYFKNITPKSFSNWVKKYKLPLNLKKIKNKRGIENLNFEYPDWEE